MIKENRSDAFCTYESNSYISWDIEKYIVSGGGTGMDVLNHIKEEHDEFRELMKEIESAKGKKKK
ncbi:MAG TPA: hypothetical protein DHM90_09155, partial [Clostridiaceae bacterium]|nr:hypothetical protein [Clostridiaceae bacterium]